MVASGITLLKNSRFLRLPTEHSLAHFCRNVNNRRAEAILLDIMLHHLFAIEIVQELIVRSSFSESTGMRKASMSIKLPSFGRINEYFDGYSFLRRVISGLKAATTAQLLDASKSPERTSLYISTHGFCLSNNLLTAL